MIEVTTDIMQQKKAYQGAYNGAIQAELAIAECEGCVIEN